MTKPPTVSYAGPSGTGAPSRSRTSSGRHSPGTVHVPSGLARPVVGARSCSSLTSPTISSIDVLEGDDARRAAVLVDDHGELDAASRSSSSSGSSRIVSGTRVASIISAVTGTSSRRSCGTAMARLTCTSPSMSSQSSPITGKREWPVRRASRSTSSAVAVRSTAVQRTRGLITSAAVRSPKSQGAGDEQRGALVEGADLGGAAHQGGELLRGPGAGQLLLRLMPTARRTRLAEPLSTTISGRVSTENTRTGTATTGRSAAGRRCRGTAAAAHRRPWRTAWP